MFSVSIMFGSFGHYSKWVDSQFVWSPPVLKLAVAACLTGATEAVLTPLERVQMLLQDRSFHKDYKNTIDALVKMRKFGLAEYYRGLTCVLVRNGPSNILFFGLRDEIKKWISPRKQNAVLIERMQQINGNNPNLGTKLIATDVRRDSNKLNFIIICHDFLSGAILGMFISTLFYPLSVVRTRMQTRAPGTEFLSIVKAFRQVYNERDQKISRLFHGCFMNVMRQFLSWGIINCSYEIVLDALRRHD